MNALSIDCAETRFCVSAKKNETVASVILDAGMKQSELLVPTIDDVFKKIHLQPNELDYLAATKGPGSFTGLRLSFASLKAISHAFSVPFFAFPTLEVYAHPFRVLSDPVLCVLDAKKDRFYAGVFLGENIILNDGDYETEKILSSLAHFKTVNLTGSGSALFLSHVQNEFFESDIAFQKLTVKVETGRTLFLLAEKALSEHAEPVKDFGGPLYLRKSEAEEKLAEKK